MKILSVINYPVLNGNSNKNLKTSVNPAFGYCEPHMRLMRTLNESIQKSINTNFAEYRKVQMECSDYMAKLQNMEQMHKKAAQLITQYANYEYSMAEVIPSYALECASDVMTAINNTQIFGTPQDILLTIANIPKLSTVAAVDNNTGKAYTPEQARKSRANSQLYSTVILLDLLDKSISSAKLNKDEKHLVLSMRQAVLSSINSVYGDDAYNRIKTLKMMGKDASTEDKRASLELMKDFDNKAKDLNFGDNFYKNLDKLLKHKETLGTEIEDAFTDKIMKTPPVMLRYHTHPQMSEQTHEHIHTHDYMHQHGIPHTHQHEEIREENILYEENN